MEKETIEYIKSINKKQQNKIEVKDELIKKINNFRWISKIEKEELIKKITDEIQKNEKKEKYWDIIKEISEQNNSNKEKRENLIVELTKIKSEIQKEKRRYSMLKKILIKEDFSWEDEYTIKKKKKKWDNIKVKIDQYDKKIKELKEKKMNIEKEISWIEILEDNRKVHNSWKSLEKNESKYKKYTLNELLKQDIWLSKELKTEIKKLGEAKPDIWTRRINSFANIVKVVCSWSVITAILFAGLSRLKDPYEIIVIVWWILWIWLYILTKKTRKNLLKDPKKVLNTLKSFWILLVVWIYFFILLSKYSD